MAEGFISEIFHQSDVTSPDSLHQILRQWQLEQHVVSVSRHNMQAHLLINTLSLNNA
jgi:hypothetical protein